jgi:glycerophosphoryl diester phosphodiesterase
VTRRFGVLAATACLALVGSAGVASATPRQDVLDIAHRGASAYAPENTLSAVEKAVALDATVVEIDVQRTADGELILMHDTNLVRTTDAEVLFPGRDSYDVADFTVAEVDQLDAGSWFGATFAGEPVPTLDETLDLMRELGVGLLLEVKAPELYPGIERQIAKELTRNPYWLRPSPDRLVIQSFNWESMRRSHQLLPWIPHGLLGRVAEAEIPTYARWADQINPSYTTVDAAYVRAVHDAGMEVHVYTVNKAEDMRAQIAKGVDGIISNYPDVLRGVIAEQARPAAA